MRMVRSLLYGYAGAVLAGLLIALFGSGFGLAPETVVSVAGLAGPVLGIVGFSLPWWQPLVAARTRNRGN